MKLVNRLFYEETWAAIEANFRGQLDLTHTAFEVIQAFEKHKDSTSWLMPLVVKLIINRASIVLPLRMQTVEDFIVNTLPNLKTLTTRCFGVKVTQVTTDDRVDSKAVMTISDTTSSRVYPMSQT